MPCRDHKGINEGSAIRLAPFFVPVGLLFVPGCASWHCDSGGFPRPAGGERSELLPGPPAGRKPHSLPSAPGTGGNRHRLFVHRQLPDPSLLYSRGPSDVRNVHSNAIGTGEALLMYGMRLRMRSVQESAFWCTEGVFGGSVSTPGGYFVTDFWEDVIITFPTRRDFAAPSRGRAGFLRAGSKKNGKAGFPPVRLRIRRAMGRARRPCRPRKTLSRAWDNCRPGKTLPHA